MPRWRASSTNPKRPTLPPPDLGFIRRTALCAGPTDTPGGGPLLSDRTSRASACRVAKAATPKTAMTSSNAKSVPRKINRISAARSATRAAAIAMNRRTPVRVKAYAAETIAPAMQIDVARSSGQFCASVNAMTVKAATTASSARMALSRLLMDTDCMAAPPSEP